MSPLDLHKRYIQEKFAFESPANAQPVIMYQATERELTRLKPSQKIGMVFLFISIGALLAAIWPFVGLEVGYAFATAKLTIAEKVSSAFKKEESVAQTITQPEFNPLLDAAGNEVVPVNNDFALVIPSIGVNAGIIPGVNPNSTAGYNDALKKGVAHSSTSFYPDENGTVYLFSHSTNYEWFVDDLNAVFYLLKNVKEGDLVVVMYMGDRYTYRIRESKVVGNREVAYLNPQYGTRTLILQTCWPPGTFYKRMLFFADFVEVKRTGTFEDEMFKRTEFGKMVRLASIYGR